MKRLIQRQVAGCDRNLGSREIRQGASAVYEQRAAPRDLQARDIIYRNLQIQCTPTAQLQLAGARKYPTILNCERRAGSDLDGAV